MFFCDHTLHSPHVEYGAAAGGCNGLDGLAMIVNGSRLFRLFHPLRQVDPRV